MGFVVADNKGVVQACPTCGQRNRVGFGALGISVRCGSCKTPLPQLSSPINVEEEAVFNLLTGESPVPVLVDFWADWCGPCKMMAPELERFAGLAAGSVAVAKVNTEVVPAVAQRFNIAAIPTLILFRNGKEAARQQGACSAAQLQRFVQG